MNGVVTMQKYPRRYSRVQRDARRAPTIAGKHR